MSDPLPQGEVNGVPYTVELGQDENNNVHYVVRIDGDELLVSPNYTTKGLEKLLIEHLRGKEHGNG